MKRLKKAKAVKKSRKAVPAKKKATGGKAKRKVLRPKKSRAKTASKSLAQGKSRKGVKRPKTLAPKAMAASRRKAPAKASAPVNHWLNPEHAPVDDLTSSGDELLDIFQKYDRNRSGAIERAEFARLLEALGQELGEEELQIALDEVDSNHSGQISYNEFRRWWQAR